jgi:integrase
MSKPLTAAAVAKLRPGKKRLEIPDGGSPGLYLIIQPSGAKSYANRHRRPDGKPAKLTLGTCDVIGRESEQEPVIGGHLTLASARRLNAEVCRQIELGADPAAARVAEKQRRRQAAEKKAANSFSASARSFVDEYTVPKKGRKPRRWREIARLLGLDYPIDGGDPVEVPGGLFRRWGDRSIADIDGHNIYSVIDEARRRGVPGMERHNNGLSDARGRKIADALSSLFGWLKDHRKITINPCDGVWRPGPPTARDRRLNYKADVRRGDEVRWFWSGCDALGEPFGPLFKLLLLKGNRLTELSRLRRDELSDNLVTVHIPGERTKNGLPIDVPLSPLARDILRAVKPVGRTFVFSTNGRTPVSGFSKIKKRLDAAMLSEARKERGEDATIPPWRLHDLRRTAASGMAGIGIAPHIVEACLNHISGAKASVAGIYNREEYEPQKRAALERWAEYLQGLVNGRPAKVVPIRGR